MPLITRAAEMKSESLNRDKAEIDFIFKKFHFETSQRNSSYRLPPLPKSINKSISWQIKSR